MSPRYTGIVVGTDRRGGVTVRVGDKLIVVPGIEAQRDGVHLQPGDLVTLRIDKKTMLPLGCDLELAEADAK